MTVTTTITRAVLLANGTATSFPFNFPVASQSDLEVTLFPDDGGVAIPQASSEYAVVLSGVGGTVVFSAAPPDEHTVVIERITPVEQPKDFRNQGKFYPESHERGFDRAVMQIQELRDAAARTLGFDYHPSETYDVTIPRDRAGLLLGWGADGSVELYPVASRLEATPAPVASIALMQAILEPASGDAVLVTEEHRGGVFVFVPSAVGPADGGTTFKANDATPGSWVRRVDGPVNALWWGAAGDGVTDDTLALQACFDAVLTGVIRVPPLEYLVSKNAALNYLNGDEPCLEIRGANDLVVDCRGAVFKVNVHAQGILEMQECVDCDVIGLTLMGPGDFPDLDGTSGSGEKGTPSVGYNTTNAGIWGFYKNNRFDTSANSSGGFGGAFPQYGGGNAATWGMWNGGFIGNIAYGLLIQNGCERITVRDCKASEFNYVGLAVGHPGDSALAENKDIRFVNCVGTFNQSAGIHTLLIDGGTIDGCILSDNGHPDWLPSNTTAQAGYGYTARGIPVVYSKNVVVSGCLVEGNDRKGLDAHAGDGIHFVNNAIRNCGINGISVPHTDSTQPCRSIIIKDNLIRNCSYATGNLAVILGGGPIDAGYSYANSLCDLIIDGNMVLDCGGTGIEIKNGRNIQITNNILRGYDDRATGLKYFMFLGRLATVEPIYNLNCSGNVCDADGDTDRYRGISVRYARNSQVNHNMLYMDSVDVTEGLTLHQCTTTQAFGNVAYLNPASATSVPLALVQTDGMVIGNYSDPDAGLLSYPLGFETTADEREKAFRIPNLIQVDITFNGTASPDFTVNAGADYVDTVAELAVHGVAIQLKNMHSTVMTRTSFNIKSAGGLTRSGGTVDFIYERGADHTSILIGLKISASGALLVASQVLSGTLSVQVLVF